MGCACQNKRNSFEVVQDNGEGRVVFSSSSQATAEAVSRRYTGSIVRDKKTGMIVYPKQAATP